jgi:hypothetical protein
MNFLLTTLLIATAQTQTCSSVSGTALTTFNQCIRNTLVDTNGSVGKTNAFDACSAIQNDQENYYRCLCNKYQGIVGWYFIFNTVMNLFVQMINHFRVTDYLKLNFAMQLGIYLRSLKCLVNLPGICLLFPDLSPKLLPNLLIRKNNPIMH